MSYVLRSLVRNTCYVVLIDDELCSTTLPVAVYLFDVYDRAVGDAPDIRHPRTPFALKFFG
jgi:hypothetical protein